MPDLWMPSASRQPRQARLPADRRDGEERGARWLQPRMRAVRYLVETVEAAKKEPEHQHK